MLGYKTSWNGGTLIVADRWFPSSKTCSACGTVKAKLPLAERTYKCDACGLVLDRDVNASRNLLYLAASGAERLNACGGIVRPGPAGHVPAKQEPGTAPADKTGTAETSHGTFFCRAVRAERRVRLWPEPSDTERIVVVNQLMIWPVRGNSRRKHAWIRDVRPLPRIP